MRKGPLFSFYCLLLLLGLSIVIIPKDVCAPLPDVTISLDDEEIEVDVGPGSDGVAYFSGKVESDNHVQMIEVTLEGEAEGAAVTITPITLYLEPGETEKPFNGEVKVSNFRSSKQPITLTISGKAKPVPGAASYSLNPCTGIINIKPYMIIVSARFDDRESGEPGDRIDFDLIIENHGNCDDRFTIALSDMNEPEVTKWKVTFSEDSFTLKSCKSTNITAYVNIPDDASGGEYEVILITTSTDKEGKMEIAEAQCYLYVVVRSDDFFDAGNWTMYALFIVLSLVIALVVWKRKPVLEKFKRRGK